MGIECREGLALGCAGAVARSIVDHSARRERGFCEKMRQGEPPRKPEGQICSGIRRTTTDRGEARRILLMEIVVSCGSGDQRWRTKLHLGSREPFDDYRSSTLGAEPKISGVVGARGVLLCLQCRAEQQKTKRQERGTAPVGQEAEVADAYEAVRKQVQQERRRNSSRERVISRCSFLWAESRQRKVTFWSAKETSRWLEMATRWV